jgi:hypothetical protein
LPSPGRPGKRCSKVAQWRDGRAPSGHPKAHDYEPEPCHLIIKACHDYEARIGAKNAWPDQEEQITWARDTWRIACEKGEENYELSDRMLGIVSVSFQYHLIISDFQI